ncbi:hypothetical protein ACLB2K_059876 [Fragaria x ananassa]
MYQPYQTTCSSVSPLSPSLASQTDSPHLASLAVDSATPRSASRTRQHLDFTTPRLGSASTLQRRSHRLRSRSLLPSLESPFYACSMFCVLLTVCKTFEIGKWWKLNESVYPVLLKLAKDIFVVPCSTVASENAFSLGSRVVDPFRASLTLKTIEALVYTSD